ncbi:sensor domain-containing diguanylate cyclase [Shewanella sedimentimangrovi]|uniref:diguanylate cyclase n=1 Tax=Shewanella sedimentimangrovi TaxID=2814293 RepID=A0ABX7QWH4_9GAMM|nr:diguanylate cyclase [Shewanella sedimentimangrovi]QSX35851.1 diguanylate cyclase [Shewanella sedimentimangrovi]
MPHIGISLRQFGLAVAFGLTGLLLNLFPLPLFAAVQLIFGNTLYVLAALCLAPGLALITALLCTLGLYWHWQEPYVFMLFPLEGLWLALARRRGHYALHADLAYWLLLGIPLIYLYGLLATELPSAHLLFAVSKQAVNGLLYTSLGAILLIFIPKLAALGNRVHGTRRVRFSNRLAYVFTLFLTLTLMGSTLTFNEFFLKAQQALIDENLQNKTQYLVQATDNYISEHRTAIAQAADWLSLEVPEPEQQQEMLTRLHRHYPAFLTMLLTNDRAHIVAASPAARLLDPLIQSGDYSVADRHYFIEAFYNQRQYLSPVFLGRGFGTDPIVAISAPLFVPGNRLKPRGIIEGSLDLGRFGQLNKLSSQGSKHFIVITDEQRKVIYASPELGLESLAEHPLKPSGNGYRIFLPMMNISEPDNTHPEYIYETAATKFGWQVYVLQPFEPLLELAEVQYLRTGLLMVLAILASLWMALRISRLMTEPLEQIANHVGRFDELDQLNDSNVTVEVQSLFNRLRHSQQQLRGYQLELEEKVAERTRELELANAELQRLAERDGLTGLYNRHYAVSQFETLQAMCERSGEAITVAILDIDWFKKVNDTYGHLAGDECLRQVAALLGQEFKRDSDVVARYGGEEFLLLLPMTNALKIEDHLNSFRARLKDTTMISPSDGREFSISVSMGALVANASYAGELDPWIKLADDNLYRAKNAGRNKVFCSILKGPDNGEFQDEALGI